MGGIYIFLLNNKAIPGNKEAAMDRYFIFFFWTKNSVHSALARHILCNKDSFLHSKPDNFDFTSI